MPSLQPMRLKVKDMKLLSQGHTIYKGLSLNVPCVTHHIVSPEPLSKAPPPSIPCLVSLRECFPLTPALGSQTLGVVLVLTTLDPSKTRL